MWTNTTAEEQAIAHIQSTWHNAGPAAIFLENGRYVTYWALDTDWLFNLSWENIRWVKGKPWTALELQHGCTAIVTRDGVVVRAVQYTTEEEAVQRSSNQALMPGADNPIPGYRQIHGDFTSLGQGQFERVFGYAMKDQALVVLSRSQTEAATMKERYDACMPASAGEWERMTSTVDRLVALDEQIAVIHSELARLDMGHGNVPPGLIGMRYMPYVYISSPEQQQRLARRQQRQHQLEALEQSRRVVLLQYPILGRMEARELRAFQALPMADKIDRIGGELGQILLDIETTRENIIDGTLELWTLPHMVDATLAALRIEDEERRRWAHEKSASEQRWDMAISIGSAVLAVGLGLVATFATGGLALAAAGGALGLGAADAIVQTRDYFANDAASGSDVDPNEAIVPDDLVGHWGWLVVAWMGVGLDAIDVIRAVRAVKAAGGATDMATGISRGIDELGVSDDMAQQLRLAAGQTDGRGTRQWVSRCLSSL